MLSCSPTHRSWSATCRASGSARRRPGSGGHWQVSANTTNAHSSRLAGVQFLCLAGLSGWRYSGRSGGPPRSGRFVPGTYPYAALAGAAELWR